MRILSILAVALCLTALAPTTYPQPVPSDDPKFGIFESHTEVGKTAIPGTIELLAADKYKITGSGENIWNMEDAFHFVHKTISGDLELKADIEPAPVGKNPHRKGGWMVRQSLDADSPYADVMVHGDGLISLQYRRTKGGKSFDIAWYTKTFVPITLERHADVFTLWARPKGEPAKLVGSVSVELKDPVYVGLAVGSHDNTVAEPITFSKVSLKNTPLDPTRKRVRETFLETLDIATGERTLVTRELKSFEAPNWSPDGKLLYVNRESLMATIPVAGGEFKVLNTGNATRVNNDHGISPDGKLVAISNNGRDPAGKSLGSQIWILPSEGGTPRLVTPKRPSYWHGWSPDGKTLAYCAEREGNFDIYTIPNEGGEEKRLTDAEGLDDGPDYSPDGKQIYFNSERTGAMRIWKMNADGTNPQQVTLDDSYGDWFPHPSPDGKWLVFVSFDKTVKGHPPNKDVVIRLLPLAGGKPRTIATLFGGQGTLNVPSWSPDSKKLAFVSYRYVLPGVEAK